MVGVYVGVSLAAYFKDSIGYVGAFNYVPVVIGAILVNALPSSDRIGLLISNYVPGVSTASFALSIAWVTQTTAGHTKRVTMNAIMLIANCIGNAIGPQMWLAKFAPRFVTCTSPFALPPHDVFGSAQISCAVDCHCDMLYPQCGSPALPALHSQQGEQEA